MTYSPDEEWDNSADNEPIPNPPYIPTDDPEERTEQIFPDTTDLEDVE
ncbi:MAG: hypothetical protein R8N23_06650 [Reichenbachiella sp.]|nr:hypothetical protein [Reichenbachiella sp.]MDW3209524.1 hypothetical protein [Reichenbachiella sp.]